MKDFLSSFRHTAIIRIVLNFSYVRLHRRGSAPPRSNDRSNDQLITHRVRFSLRDSRIRGQYSRSKDKPFWHVTRSFRGLFSLLSRLFYLGNSKFRSMNLVFLPAKEFPSEFAPVFPFFPKFPRLSWNFPPNTKNNKYSYLRGGFPSDRFIVKRDRFHGSAATVKFMIWDRIVHSTNWNNLKPNAKGDDEGERKGKEKMDLWIWSGSGLAHVKGPFSLSVPFGCLFRHERPFETFAPPEY